MSSEEILAEASRLSSDTMTRQCLLEGATDPPGQKQTHNGYDFSGSVTNVEPGVFCGAIGGLPLFTTSDLSPTTATSGWLSFARPISPDHVRLIQPESSDAVDQRVEVVCALTGCHLGHYFGPQEGYYCINASALNFVLAAVAGGQPSSGRRTHCDTTNSPRLLIPMF